MGVQRVLDAILLPGDRFVDIGANIGMTTLHAHSLIGSTGRIDCFEPNPECIEGLRRHLQINKIKNVAMVPGASAHNRSSGVGPHRHTCASYLTPVERRAGMPLRKTKLYPPTVYWVF
jgi:tRNA G37 N-methylase Trm5